MEECDPVYLCSLMTCNPYIQLPYLSYSMSLDFIISNIRTCTQTRLPCQLMLAHYQMFSLTVVFPQRTLIHIVSHLVSLSCLLPLDFIVSDVRMCTQARLPCQPMLAHCQMFLLMVVFPQRMLICIVSCPASLSCLLLLDFIISNVRVYIQTRLPCWQVVSHC